VNQCRIAREHHQPHASGRNVAGRSSARSHTRLKFVKWGATRHIRTNAGRRARKRRPEVLRRCRTCGILVVTGRRIL
jgi:hypothetical protein